MDTSNEQPSGISMADIPKIAKKHRWLFVAVFAATILPLIVFIFFLPNQYKSTATVLVESQRIPEDLVRPTITGVVEERIQSVQQTVLTRSNVLELVMELKVYPDMADANPTRLVERFINSTEVSLSRSRIGNRPGGTTAFDLTFYSDNPKTAQLVAGELVTLFLSENARSRTARATETTEFLSEESLKIKEKVQRLEGKISEFKQIHRESMPEMFQLNMALFERAEREDQALTIDIAALRAELRQLGLQRTTSVAGTGEGEPSQSISELRKRYNHFLIDNHPDHPTAKRILRRIEAAELAVLSIQPAPIVESDGKSVGVAPSEPMTPLDLQIQTTNEKLNFLVNSKRQLDGRIVELENRISQTPVVEQQFLELKRDMDAMQLNYRDIKDKESEARIAQHLESGLKGERFSLLEPPVEPDRPSKPNRPLLLLLAFAGSVGAGVLSVVLLQLTRKNLYSNASFERALGFPPLVELPFIELVEDVEHAKRRMRLGLAASVACATLLLGIVHFYYRNLDDVWAQLVSNLVIG